MDVWRRDVRRSWDLGLDLGWVSKVWNIFVGGIVRLEGL